MSTDSPQRDETFSEVWDLPIFHIAISRNKGSEVILALSPRRWCDLQAAYAIEFANGLRIQDQLVPLANHLQIPAALKFEFENSVLEVLGGTIMQVLRGHGPKAVAQVFEDIVKDPSKAAAHVNESRLHDLVIRTLSEQISIDAPTRSETEWARKTPARLPKKRKPSLGSRPPDAAARVKSTRQTFSKAWWPLRKPFAPTSVCPNTVAMRPARRCFDSVRPCSTC